MTATLPPAVQAIFQRFVTTELTTIDSRGQPVTWPVTPFYRLGDPCIRVTTGLGYPRKAHDARRNPKVALLFSDDTGSGIERPSMVLVQGTAEVDDGDLAANRERYVEDTAAKPTGGRPAPPASATGGRFDWYYTRIYLHVRPERVYVWPGGDCGLDPELLLDIRAASDDSDDAGGAGGGDAPAGPGGGPARWHGRIKELDSRHESAVLSFVEADGYPFSIRVPMAVPRRERAILVDADRVGAPLRPGLACVTAHDHDDGLTWTRNFQVRGDLLERPSGGWMVVPQRVVHGFELPPAGALTRALSNYRTIRRYRRTAKRERARRGGRA